MDNDQEYAKILKLQAMIYGMFLRETRNKVMVADLLVGKLLRGKDPEGEADKRLLGAFANIYINMFSDDPLSPAKVERVFQEIVDGFGGVNSYFQRLNTIVVGRTQGSHTLRSREVFSRVNGVENPPRSVHPTARTEAGVFALITPAPFSEFFGIFGIHRRRWEEDQVAQSWIDHPSSFIIDSPHASAKNFFELYNGVIVEVSCDNKNPPVVTLYDDNRYCSAGRHRIFVPEQQLR